MAEDHTDLIGNLRRLADDLEAGKVGSGQARDAKGLVERLASATHRTASDPSKGGRPSKLNVTTMRRYYEARELGGKQGHAARHARVHPDTVRRWITVGRAAVEDGVHGAPLWDVREDDAGRTEEFISGWEGDAHAAFFILDLQADGDFVVESLRRVRKGKANVILDLLGRRFVEYGKRKPQDYGGKGTDDAARTGAAAGGALGRLSDDEIATQGGALLEQLLEEEANPAPMGAQADYTG